MNQVGDLRKWRGRFASVAFFALIGGNMQHAYAAADHEATSELGGHSLGEGKGGAASAPETPFMQIKAHEEVDFISQGDTKHELSRGPPVNKISILSQLKKSKRGDVKFRKTLPFDTPNGIQATNIYKLVKEGYSNGKTIDDVIKSRKTSDHEEMWNDGIESIGSSLEDTYSVYAEPSLNNGLTALKSFSGIVKAFAPFPAGAIIGAGMSLVAGVFVSKDAPSPTNQDVMNNITAQFKKMNKKLDKIDNAIQEGFRQQKKSLEALNVMMRFMQRTTENTYKELWMAPFERIQAAYTNLIETYMPEEKDESWDDFFMKASEYRSKLDSEVYDAFDTNNIRDYLRWFETSGTNGMGMCGQAVEFQFINTIRSELLQISLLGSFNRKADCDSNIFNCWESDEYLSLKYIGSYAQQMDEWNIKILNAKSHGGLGIGHLVGMESSDLLAGVHVENGRSMGFCFPCKGATDDGDSCKKPFGPTKFELENGHDSLANAQQCDATSDVSGYECCSCSCLHKSEFSPNNPNGGSVESHRKLSRHCEIDEEVYYPEHLVDQYLKEASLDSSSANECRLVSTNTFRTSNSCNNECTNSANATLANCIQCRKNEKQICAEFCLRYVRKNLRFVSVDPKDDGKYACSCHFRDGVTNETIKMSKNERIDCQSSSPNTKNLRSTSTQRSLSGVQMKSYEIKNLVYRVNIKAAGENPLHMKEVHVLDPSKKTNWALRKQAQQSSTYSESGSLYPASNALDEYSHSSRTNVGINNWWQVDLESAKPVGAVHIIPGDPSPSGLTEFLNATVSLYAPRGAGYIRKIVVEDISTDDDKIIKLDYASFEEGTHTLTPTPSPTKRPTSHPVHQQCYETSCSKGGCSSGYDEVGRKSCVNWGVYYKERCCRWVN